MNRTRLVLGLLAAGLFLLLLGPPRAFVLSRGWRTGRSAAPWFHRLLCAALGVEVRGVLQGARVVTLPFYKRS